MPCFARLAAIVLPLALCAAAAAPRPAAAEQPCSGTFCDFYYGGSSGDEKPAPQGAPTPLTVPGTGFLGRILGGGGDTSQTPAAPGTTAPPAKKPLVAVHGGGVLGMMRGDAPERCSGTFCDLYYGGPPPEKPADPPAVAAAPDGGVAPVPASDQDAAPPPEDRVRETVERREPEHCAAQGADPWSCYRK